MTFQFSKPVELIMTIKLTTIDVIENEQLSLFDLSMLNSTELAPLQNRNHSYPI